MTEMEKLTNKITGDNLHVHNNELENIQNNTFGINEPLLKDTCVVHKGAKLDYLSVDSAQNFVFKCMYCITDDNSNQLALVPIEQILMADSKTVFANFPLKDRDLTREIKQIAQNPPTGALIKQSIDNFFKEFRVKLLDRIDSIQQKMVEKAQSISDFGEVLMNNYNRVSSKEQIKQIVSDRHKPIESKSTELKDICAEKLSKDKENTQLFTSLINSMKTLQKATDFETPKLISESILKQLESINMFLVEDIANLQESLFNTVPQSFQQQGKQTSDLDAVANLMKLVRNKLNDVSSESCEQLEEQLNQFKFIFTQLNVPVPGSVFENLNSFNDEETKVFKGLISKVAKEKECRLAEEGESGQILREDREMSEKQKLNSNQIIEFVSNRTNFCSAEYIEDMSKVMKTMSGLFGLFQVRKPGSKSVERAAFNGLNQKQLGDMVKLATQINLLNLNHSNLYLHSRLPYQEIQSNSTQLMRYISNHFYFRDGSVKEKAKVKMDLNQLLVQYPIFELLPPLPYFKFLPITFTRTKYGNSSEMGVTMNGNQVELTFPKCVGKYGQAVSEKLNNESGYRIKLKFNQPYEKHGPNSGYFLIGLIPNSKIDQTFVLSNSAYSGFTSYPNHGAELVPRGNRLSSEPVRSQTNEVEIRWCIQKRQFFISDQSYQNVNQAKQEYFTPAEEYRFGVCFSGIPKSEWKVTISDYQEIDPSEVPLFL